MKGHPFSLFPFRRKRRLLNPALVLLLTAHSAILLAGAMLAPIYALYVDRIGGDLLDASLASAIFATAAGVATLVSARYSDRLRNPKLIVVLGYFIMGMGFFAMGLVNSVWQLLIVQAIIGLGEAVYTPAFDSLYTSHIERGKSARQWGAWESMYYFTTATGALLGGLLVTAFGFEVMFALMGVMCLGAATYVYLQPKKAV